MTFSFHPEAEAEFCKAVDYYEEVEYGLGYDFSIEVYAAIQRIVDYPEAWPLFEDEIRRCLTKRFPFGLLYSIGRNHIFVLAVMHLHRYPGSFEDRRKE
jgi:hypothetical protein